MELYLQEYSYKAGYAEAKCRAYAGESEEEGQDLYEAFLLKWGRVIGLKHVMWSVQKWTDKELDAISEEWGEKGRKDYRKELENHK